MLKTSQTPIIEEIKTPPPILSMDSHQIQEMQERLRKYEEQEKKHAGEK